MSRRILYCTIVLLPLLAGCPEEPKPKSHTTPLPFAGQEIRIGVPADRGFRTAWEAPLNEWAAQTGAKYTLTELPAGDAASTYAALQGDDGQTLAIFPLEQAGELFGAGSLAPLPPSILGDDELGVQWRDLFSGLAGKLAARKGTPMFVPLACPVLVCYYRRDLLSAAGLNPPQTWEDYQQLLEKLPVWAPGLTAVEPWSELFRPTMLLARGVSAAQHPGHFSLFFDIETGAPLIDSPGFVRALEMARAAFACMPSDVLTWNPEDCRSAMLKGRAALAIAIESPVGGASADAAASAVKRPEGMAIGFVRLPGARETYNPTRHAWEPVAGKGIHQVTLCGFAGLAIGASSRNSSLQTEAGWNALAKARGQSFVSGFPSGILGLCRESQLSDPDAAAGSGLEGDEAEDYTNVVATSLRDSRLVAEIPVTGRSEFRKALARSIGEVFAGSQTPKAGLQQAGRDWRAIVERIGAEKVRDNYRLSLGLSPLSKRN